MIRDTIKTGLPQPSEFLVFNTRRPVFADIRVREALTLLFDFEWINRNYFFGLYARSAGYFAGSELSAYRPRRRTSASARCCSRIRSRCAPTSSTAAIGCRSSDGSGRDREALRRALALLAQAGYELDGTVLRQRRQRAAAQPSRSWSPPAIRSASRWPSPATSSAPASRRRSARSMRVQFDQRRLAFDFDMIQNRWDQSLSPGNEQAFYWGSAAADNQGTRNYMGARDPAIDAMIAAMLEARGTPDFVAAVRALDRVLISGFYAIPLLQRAGAMDRALESDRTAASHRVERLSARNLVAATLRAAKVIP